jgi:hypothetical protein
MTDVLAQPHTCTRCARPTLLAIAGRCAACIGEMGLRHPQEYQSWKADVNSAFGRR